MLHRPLKKQINQSHPELANISEYHHIATRDLSLAPSYVQKLLHIANKTAEHKDSALHPLHKAAKLAVIDINANLSARRPTIDIFEELPHSILLLEETLEDFNPGLIISFLTHKLSLTTIELYLAASKLFHAGKFEAAASAFEKTTQSLSSQTPLSWCFEAHCELLMAECYIKHEDIPLLKILNKMGVAQSSQPAPINMQTFPALGVLIKKIKEGLAQNKNFRAIDLINLIKFLEKEQDETLFNLVLNHFKKKRDFDSIKELYEFAVKIKNPEFILSCFYLLTEDPIYKLKDKAVLAHRTETECKERVSMEHFSFYSTILMLQTKPDGLVKILQRAYNPMHGEKDLPIFLEGIKNWVEKFGRVETFATYPKEKRHEIFLEITTHLPTDFIARLTKEELLSKWKTSENPLLAEALLLEFAECEQCSLHSRSREFIDNIKTQFNLRSNIVYRLHFATPQEKNNFKNIHGTSNEEFVKRAEQFNSSWDSSILIIEKQLYENRETILESIEKKLSPDISKLAWEDDLFAIHFYFQHTEIITHPVAAICLSLKILLLAQASDRFLIPSDVLNEEKMKALANLNSWKNKTLDSSSSLELQILKQFAGFACELVSNKALTQIMHLKDTHTDTVISAAIIKRFGADSVNTKNFLKLYKSGIKFAYAHPNFNADRIDEIGHLLYPKPLAPIPVGTLSLSVATLHGQGKVAEEKKTEPAITALYTSPLPRLQSCT